MPYTPITTTCMVAGLSVTKWGNILRCPDCGQRTRCRHKLKRHLDAREVDGRGKLRCKKMLDDDSISREQLCPPHDPAADVEPPSPLGPGPEHQGIDCTVGNLAAAMLDCIGDATDDQFRSTTNVPTLHPLLDLDSPTHCAGNPFAADMDDEVRVRGGVGRDDPVDAAEFFHQYGLPNLLSDNEDESADGDPCHDGTVGWPVAQLLRPLYPGSHYNVQQFAYALFKIKTGSIRDDRADQLCKMIAEIMPEGYEGPKCECPPTSLSTLPVSLPTFLSFLQKFT